MQMWDRVSILSTKELEAPMVEEIVALGELTQFELLPYFPVEPVKTEFYKNIIFTSYKATKRGLQILGEAAKDHHFFCVGKKSEMYLRDRDLEVYGFANYSMDLAQLIVENLSASAFSYLCSEDRLDTLPDLLKANAVTIDEVHTYRTSVCDQMPEGNYDIYLWYSPKGVQSFSQQIMPDAIHICIGQTTAQAVQLKYPASQHIFFPESPSIENMISLIRQEVSQIRHGLLKAKKI